MNRQSAEDYVYQSYLKAEQHQDYSAKDSEKRHPEFTYKILRGLCHTPCVVVTGSKGKGSVSNMISLILQTRMKVGLMTSPHLIDFCERFQIDNKQITEEVFVKNMEEIRPLFDEKEKEIRIDEYISPIGIQAALALSCFHEAKTDFNIFEGGKGARYDDVSNLKHQYAVINSIFLEHTRELGDTLEKIAEDKSHVIDGEQKAVFVAEQKEEVLSVIKKRAEDKKVPLKIYGRDFAAENIRFTAKGMLFDVRVDEELYRDISIPLLGEHQARNCALALALAKEVLGELHLEAVRENLAKMQWPGRLEIISKDPFVVLDACINKESCRNVTDVLRRLEPEKYTAVIGIPDDKDYKGVALEIGKLADQIILTKSQNRHYVFTEKQK